MKTEIMKDSGHKDRKIIEKNTMKACLNCLENLFKYYKLVKKQKNEDNVLIFSHSQAGEFKVSIMEIKQKGEKKPISLGVNIFKSLAMYFALKSFFETYVEGSFTSINGVYRNLQNSDNTYFTKKEVIESRDKPLDMISQDLLNEIENYI